MIVFENWNRYYDPFTGRMLQPEPMLTIPAFSFSEVLAGRATPTYVYGYNNPLYFVDEDGLVVKIQATRRWDEIWWAKEALRNCPCMHDFYVKCYGSDPYEDETEHDVSYDPDDWTQELQCRAHNAFAITAFNSTAICSKRFGSKTSEGGTTIKQGTKGGVMGTLAHELAHQMSLRKTGHGWTSEADECSSEAAERLAKKIAEEGCEKACCKKNK